MHRRCDTHNVHSSENWTTLRSAAAFPDFRLAVYVKLQLRRNPPPPSLIRVYFLITASSAYALSPQTKTRIFGSRICPRRCLKVGHEQPRVLIVLRWRLVLEVVQPSRTLSRFHPQRRALPLSTFCWLMSPTPFLWTDKFWQAVCQNATILSAPIGTHSPKLSVSSLLSRPRCSWISLLS